MQRMMGILKPLVLALMVCVTLVFAAADAMADKLYLKDGTTYDGRVVREGDAYVYFAIKTGGIETEKLFLRKDIDRIETDADAEPAETEMVKSETDEPEFRADVKRVAILNFGPPQSWGNDIGNTVGIQISAAAWEDAIPLLEEDGVTDVVVLINSGGGLLLELVEFHRVFRMYKEKFRTVAWVESAISAAAMSPYVLEEFYFKSEGNLGACTGWFGALQNVEGWPLERVLYQMEEVSEEANRDPLIMRAMQVEDPLSADIDDTTGEVTWYKDETSGTHLVNPAGQILTLDSVSAMKYKFARGIADTPDELMEAMGYQEYEWGGDAGIKAVDDSMRDGHRTETKFGNMYYKYALALQAAPGIQDCRKRGAELARAKRYLQTMERAIAVNPNFKLLFGIPDEWFDQQRELIRELRCD